MRGLARWTVAVVLLIAPGVRGQEPAPPEKIAAPVQPAIPLDTPALATPPPTYPVGYVDAGFLFWWVKHGPAPILLTTAPNNGLNVNGLTGGTLGQPGTTTVYDGSNLLYGPFTGARVTAGVNLGPTAFWSLEVGGFLLPRRSINYANGAGGAPLLTVPFLDAATGQQASLDISSLDANNNPFLAGSMYIHSDLQVWGIEANAIAHSVRTADRSIDVFAGLRTLSLNENLAVDQTVVGAQSGNMTIQYPTVGQGAANYYAVVAGAPVQVNDAFSTRNQFYGTQLGGRFRWYFGNFSADLTGKLALGVTHQEVTIDGSSTAAAAINPNTGAIATNLTTQGGMFALKSNIGSYSQNPFTMVPELGVNLTWSPARWFSVRLGYSILYWTNVARPGAQIDTVLNSKLIPTGALLPTTTVPIGAFIPGSEQYRPAFSFNDTAFWAQGVQLGIELRY